MELVAKKSYLKIYTATELSFWPDFANFMSNTKWHVRENFSTKSKNYSKYNFLKGTGGQYSKT